MNNLVLIWSIWVAKTSTNAIYWFSQGPLKSNYSKLTMSIITTDLKICSSKCKYETQKKLNWYLRKFRLVWLVSKFYKAIPQKHWSMHFNISTFSFWFKFNAKKRPIGWPLTYLEHILRQSKAENSSFKALLNIKWLARDPNWLRLPVMFVWDNWNQTKKHCR